MATKVHVIRIEFPALDRLLDYLETDQQQEVDTATAEVAEATRRLQQSTGALDSAVKKDK